MLEADLGARNAALAGTVVVNRAAVKRRKQRGKSFGALLQLVMVDRRVDAEVVEEREGEGSDDGNAVFRIACEAGVAADGGDAVNRQRHLNALVVLRVGRVARNALAVRIGELEVNARGHVAVGRSAAHVKATHIHLAAAVEAVVGRRHVAGDALDVIQLRANRQHIAPPNGGDEIVHGDVALVGNGRVDIAHVAPQAGNLQESGVLFAIVGAQRVRNRVVGVAEAEIAIDDAGQRVRALNSRAESNGLEKCRRSRAEGRNRGLGERVGHADALERMSLERVADGEIHAV